jgi:thymidylate synthase ThyX
MSRFATIGNVLLVNAARDAGSEPEQAVAFRLEALFGIVEKQNKDFYREIMKVMEKWKGEALFNKKQARGAARGFLSHALKTELIFTASIRQWQHMIKMRHSAYADGEIREIYADVLKVLRASAYANHFTDKELEL